MRIRRLPKGYYWLASRSWPDLPESARLRFDAVSLIERLCSKGESVVSACALVGVPRSSYYRWRQRLRRDGAMALRDGRAGNRRRRSAPVRVLLRPLIIKWRSRFPLGKEKLAVVLARLGVRVSASSVHRVLSELFESGKLQRIGYAGRSAGRRRRAAKRAHAQRKQSSMRPLRPGELVQIDTLHERSIVGRPRYQFTAVDPSGKQLHAQLYSSASSRNAALFLEELVAAFSFPLISIQVDNGSEFRGEFEAACQARGIGLYTIPPATPKANGMVERAQRSFREEHYAFEPATLDLEGERAALAEYVRYYNHERPHQALGYLTPVEYAESRNL